MSQSHITELCDRYDFFLLDLDNTLYDETKYLYPAYQVIAKKLASDYSLNATELESFLIYTFEMEGRDKLLDKLCDKFEIPKAAVQYMLSAMRGLKLSAPIDLFPAATSFMDILVRERKEIFIVTNGNLQQQKNKVASINWGDNLQKLKFIYTAELEPKPNRAAFDYIFQKFHASPEKSVMIGDSETDEQFAMNSGIRFVHVGKILANNMV